MSAPKSDPSAVVVPFGKHKGTTVAELLVRDQGYVEWLLGQGWLAERFAELHAALLTRGAAPDDTPEHNALQVRFLDAEFCLAFWFALNEGLRGRVLHDVGPTMLKRWRKFAEDRRPGQLKSVALHRKELEQCQARGVAESDYSKRWREAAEHELAALESLMAASEPPARVVISQQQFEQRGIDATFVAWIGVDWPVQIDQRDYSVTTYTDARFTIEIKPSLGDDYPAVMRQMSRLGASQLLVGSYCGRGASLERVSDMFDRNNRTLVMLQEVEAELPYARRVLENVR